MKRLNGQSGCIVLQIEDMVLKISTNEKSKEKLIGQINKIKCSKNIYYPSMIDHTIGEFAAYIMPYYEGATLYESSSTNAINKVLDYIIETKSTKRVTEDFIKCYYHNKINPLLIHSDMKCSELFLENLTDFESLDFHGDLTFENIIMPSKTLNGFIFLDTDKCEYESWGLELGKFLCSLKYGFESVKLKGIIDTKENNEFDNYLSNKISSAELKTAKFYAATHFLRMLPYKNNDIYRTLYNKIIGGMMNE